jgi:hypothetical protein
MAHDPFFCIIIFCFHFCATSNFFPANSLHLILQEKNVIHEHNFGINDKIGNDINLKAL